MVAVVIAGEAQKRFRSKLEGVEIVPDGIAISAREVFKADQFARLKELGEKLWPGMGLGYENAGLLTSYYFQTPNNSLPLIWADGKNNHLKTRPSRPWTPLFRRDPKGGSTPASSPTPAVRNPPRRSAHTRTQSSSTTPVPGLAETMPMPTPASASVSALQEARSVAVVEHDQPYLAAALLLALHKGSLPKTLVDQLAPAIDSLAGGDDLHVELATMLLVRKLQSTRSPDIDRIVLADRLDTLLGRAAPSPLTRAHALHIIGWARNLSGDTWEAQGYLGRALKASQEAGDDGDAVRAQILNTAGYAFRARKSFDEADRSFEESFKIKSALEDWIGLEMTRQALGWMWLMRGYFETSREKFLEGLRATSVRLAAPPRSVTSEQLPAIALSLHFHLIGFCTASFLGQMPAASFEEVYEETRAMLDALVPFTGVEGRAVFQEARDMFDLGMGVPLRELLDSEPRQEHLRLLADCLDDPPQHFSALHTHLGTRIEDTGGDVDVQRMKFLATISLLCRRSSSVAPATELFLDLIERLERHGYDGMRELRSRVQRQKIGPASATDSSRWADWGPLQYTSVALARAEPWLNPMLTAQYLQILAWISTVLLAADGGVDRRAIYQLLDKSFQEDSAVRLNIGQSFGTCFRVASAEGCNPTTPWGRALKTLWLDEHGLLDRAGYGSRTDLAAERNRFVHGGWWTDGQCEIALAKHFRLMAEMSAPLRGGALPRIESSGPLAGAPAGFKSVVLVDGERRFDCGALLLMRPEEEPEFAVPHLLHRTSLRGRRGHSSEFLCLSRATTRRINIKWHDR